MAAFRMVRGTTTVLLGVLVVALLAGSLPLCRGAATALEYRESWQGERSAYGEMESMGGSSTTEKGLFWWERMAEFIGAGPGGADARMWPEFKVSWKMAIATVIGFIGAALANAGGVGGGPLFVSMFNLLLGYDAKTSTALSKAMVFGGALASITFNVQLKHPTQNRALIDYGIAVLLQPTLLLGISIGVTCNVMFPSWLIKLLLVLLLFLMTNRTVKKGISSWKQEAHHAKAKEITESSIRQTADIEHVPEGGAQSDVAGAVVSVEEERSQSNGAASNLQEPLLGRPSALPAKPARAPFWQLVDWHVVPIILGVWLIYLLAQIIRSKVPVCGALFWIMDTLQVPVSVAASSWGAARLLAVHNERLSGQSSIGNYDHGETQWGLLVVATAPLYSLLAGITGGLLGIGGAIVMGPVLLELGLHPQVSAATCSFMILFSSSMSVIEFYLLDRIPIKVALYFGSVAVVASFTGLSIIRAVVQRSGKASILVFVLASFMGLSAVVILIGGSAKVYTDWKSGLYMGFNGICST